MSLIDTPAPARSTAPGPGVPTDAAAPSGPRPLPVALLSPAPARTPLGPTPTAPAAPAAPAPALPAPRVEETPSQQRPTMTVSTAILLLTVLSALVGTGMDMWTGHHVRSWIPAGAGYSTSFGPGWGGSLNRLSYFTAQSNLLVAASSLLLVVRPRPRGRFLPFLQLVALLCISITCIVYVGVLAGPNIGGSFPAVVIVSTVLEHVVTPLLAWAAWLLAGPATVTLRGLALASLVPVAYCGLTLVRGALVDWYPYPFLDVPARGYGFVLGAVGCVAALVPVVGLTMYACQRFLRSRPGGEPLP